MFNKMNPLLYRRYEEVINQKKIDVVGELYAPNYIRTPDTFIKDCNSIKIF